MEQITLTHKYAIYVDYTCEPIPRAFYVGKGDQRRVNGMERNALHTHIVQKHGQNRSVVFENDDEQLTLLTEEEMIAQLKTYAHGGAGWWGANLTRGGETSPMKDPHVAAKCSRSKMGHITSDETKLKISLAVRRVQARLSVKKKMSDASSKRRHSLETRAKMKASHKKRKPISETTRERIRKSALVREHLRRLQP